MSDTMSSSRLRILSDSARMSDMDILQPAGVGVVPQWTFADRLRKAREAAGLDQAELAALLAKKRSTISNWERGANRPDELALRAVAHCTGVPLAWLQWGVEPPSDRGPVTLGQEVVRLVIARENHLIAA